VIVPLYEMFVRTLLRRGRLIGLLALGAVGVVLGVAIGASETADAIDDGTVMITTYGLAVVVPVTTLLLASSVLGDPNEDGTLVYLWLRPIARWRLVVAAVAATLTVALPVIVGPMAIAAAATGGGAELIRGTAVACAIGTVAYTGVFTWLGLRVRRAVVWGLAYILVWEGFVARAGATPSRLAIRASTRSLLTRMSHGPPRLISVSMATAIIIPLLAAAIGTALTIWRLHRQDVS
jgi:ABC-2 type transport system permease protein